MNFEEASKEAVKQVLSDPEAHARLIRMSHALMAVSSIEDPNPIRATGHMLGSAVEYMLGIGLSRDFILKFTADMIDLLSNEEGQKLREAAAKQRG